MGQIGRMGVIDWMGQVGIMGLERRVGADTYDVCPYFVSLYPFIH